MQKLEKWYFLFFIISQSFFELQRHTIPHFKAHDLLFWPLAWLLSLGAIVSEVWSKIPVQIIVRHPLVHTSKASKIEIDDDNVDKTDDNDKDKDKDKNNDKIDENDKGKKIVVKQKIEPPTKGITY